MRPAALEDGERIERRAGAALDRERREGQHELVALQAARGLDGALEIEIFHNADAHPVQHGLVNGIDGDALRVSPAGARRFAEKGLSTLGRVGRAAERAEERDLALLDPRNDVRVITGDNARRRTARRPSLPAADVEQDDVAGASLDAGFFLPGLYLP